MIDFESHLINSTNLLTNHESSIRDDDQLPPQSPQVYRRATSRENETAADVFSRLGAGTTDPVPGGSIREYSGKVHSC